MELSTFTSLLLLPTLSGCVGNIMHDGYIGTKDRGLKKRQAEQRARELEAEIQYNHGRTVGPEVTRPPTDFVTPAPSTPSGHHHLN